MRAQKQKFAKIWELRRGSTERPHPGPRARAQLPGVLLAVHLRPWIASSPLPLPGVAAPVAAPWEAPRVGAQKQEFAKIWELSLSSTERPHPGPRARAQLSGVLLGVHLRP